MKTNGRYKYLSGRGYQEVYSPDNPPAMYEHQVRWTWMEGNAQCSAIVRLLSVRSTAYTTLGMLVDDFAQIISTPGSYRYAYFDLISGSFTNSQNTDYIRMESLIIENPVTSDPVKIRAYPQAHMMSFDRSKKVEDMVLKRM